MNATVNGMSIQTVDTDVVQDRLPWNTEYFKMKMFEEMAEAGRSLWPSLYPYLKQKGVSGALPIPGGSSLYLMTRKNLEESKEAGFANFLPVCYYFLILLHLSYPCTLSILHQTQHKNIQVYFFQSSFPYGSTWVT